MSNKPDFCPFIYTDGKQLFLEFDQMVLTFMFTEGGLNKALKHIPRIDQQPGYVNRNSNFPPKPSLVGHVARKTPETKVTQRTLRSRETKALRERFGHGADDVVRKLITGKLK